MDSNTNQQRTATMNTNLTTLTPTEVDTIWLDQSWQRVRAADTLRCRRDMIARFVGREMRNSNYGPRYYFHPTEDRAMTNNELLELGTLALVNSEKGYLWDCGNILDHHRIASLEEAIATFATHKAAVEACNAEWTRRGCWQRYYLVCSSNGHIHSSMSCHTCNKGRNATEFALVPSLSGTATLHAVAKLGEALCSFCFPDAPVEHREQMKVSKSLATVLRERGEAEFDKAKQVAAERAAKRAAKITK